MIKEVSLSRGNNRDSSRKKELLALTLSIPLPTWLAHSSIQNTLLCINMSERWRREYLRNRASRLQIQPLPYPKLVKCLCNIVRVASKVIQQQVNPIPPGQLLVTKASFIRSRKFLEEESHSFIFYKMNHTMAMDIQFSRL